MLKLQGQLELDGSGWKKGLDQASSSLNGLKGLLAGVFSVGAVTALTRKTIEYAGHINDLSDRLGVATGYLQEMQFVMKQNGGSVDDLTAAFEKLGAARMAALSGGQAGEKMQENFATLGVSMNALRTQGTSQIMDTIAATFKQLGNNDALKTAFKEIGGKGAGILVPSFIDGLEEGRQKARDAGAVISDESIQKLDMIGDAFDALGQQLIVSFAPAILEVAAVITDTVGQIQAALKGFEDWAASKYRGQAQLYENFDQTVRMAKYQAQQKEKLGEGKITKAEYGKRMSSARKNFGITPDDLSFSQGAAEAQDKFEKWKASVEAAIASKAARRGMDFTAPTSWNEVSGKVKTRQSDSLVSVGNFLGSSNASRVIEQIARQQLTQLQEINRGIGRMANNNSGTIQVPTTT